MENDFGTLTDLAIRFQEVILESCDQCGIDPNNLTESDWNNLHEHLSEENFNELVITAIDFASQNRGIRFADAEPADG